MRLLRIDNGCEPCLTKDLYEDIPRYAILSHKWGPDDEEVTFKDMAEGTGKSKVGYRKIQFCRDEAVRNGLKHFWIDTCCIDKSNNTELSEAIISMFRWYRNATECYVYLPDVSKDINSQTDDPSTWKAAFRKSCWFERGWTLQELIAPRSVKFFSHEGQLLGDKMSLEREIHDITGIAVSALRGTDLSKFSINERMAWALHRQTKREEDEAYCLLGIFGVNLTPRYGEGRKEASERLHRRILKRFPELQDYSTSIFSESSVPGR